MIGESCFGGKTANCHSPNQNLIALALLSPAVPLTSFLKYDFEVVAIHIFKVTFPFVLLEI